MVGLSFGCGIIVYQIGKSGDDGLARIEVGRSRFRHAASPSYIPSLALSPKFAFVLETPLSFNTTAMLGLSIFDSDDDVDAAGDTDYYCLKWAPSVRDTRSKGPGGREPDCLRRARAMP